ncbi:glucose-6-phosphate dehydrogenase [Melioribacteraceae bacterium 4301-Me]|uniref:glucose-6-phosphate dehydrogenase n=1 Tax=Pyranulibacter aquaticus TaxID=3163344 RepID=UPI003599DD85
MKNIDNHIYVIFGASGDLTKRKLVPALYSLYVQGMLPERFVLLGTSRSEFDDDVFRNYMKDAIKKFKEIDDESKIDEFCKILFYIPIGFNDKSAYIKLKNKLDDLRKQFDINGNTIFYLSTPPSLYGIIPQNLASVGLNKQIDGWKRLIIEKPFGYDLESAIKLKEQLLNNWEEEQLYRIDHYLGKETVQNLLVTRFSNGIFEPLWNRNYVHHIEITSTESIGVEKRGGYYESSGALRDMVQNHLLHIVGLIAMEPPTSVEPYAIRNEILKVFQSLRQFKKDDVRNSVIRGQYTASKIKNEVVKGYREEEGVNPESITETYAALKFYIDNWRWGGVPFYVRTGKRLPTRITEVVIHFKPTPHFLFAKKEMDNACNLLIIRIQPDEGILLKFSMKTPGAGFDVQNVNMDFHYSDLTNQRIPPAYERLLHDTMKGDSTLFPRTEEVLEAWKFLMPVIECWKNDKNVPLYGYPAGTWGPKNADYLIQDGMGWHYPCKDLAEDGVYCEL